jgi:hypothetical protein
MRHSSSLMAGISPGTIEGIRFKRTVWMSGIESPPVKFQLSEISRRQISLFGASSHHSKAMGSLWREAALTRGSLGERWKG